MSLLGRIRSLVRPATLRNRSHITGYREFLAPGQKHKRALLAYVVAPIDADLRGRRPKHFSNHGIALAWVKTLNRLGYEVDVINWDDAAWQPKNKYDLVIGHGGKLTASLLAARKPSGKLIYFSTGSYWKLHNQAAEKRADYFFKRHNVRLQPDRPVTDSEEDILKAADTIIALGTKEIKDTYRDFPRVYNLEIGAYPDGRTLPAAKDFKAARNNFLFFSGGGNLHKGLDLLLDAFGGLDQHLYICTSLTPEFEQAYADLTAPNIHYQGVVELGGKRFRELTDKCAFVILPSCAEGSPGSVADCMAQGLIPVVTPQAGVWTGKYGFSIRDIKPENIATQIKQLAGLGTKNLAERARYVYEHTKREQSPAKFEEKLEAAVANIIGYGETL